MYFNAQTNICGYSFFIVKHIAYELWRENVIYKLWFLKPEKLKKSFWQNILPQEKYASKKTFRKLWERSIIFMTVVNNIS